MTHEQLPQEETLKALPPFWPQSLLPDIKAHVGQDGRKIVVLDDDPTGTQTVHDIPVLTEWSVAALTTEFSNNLSTFYILTNSRSLPLPQAQALNREIGLSLKTVASQMGHDFVVVSRSDSTLRGHYPGETDALLDALADDVDATLVIPFFLEGGRYTIEDVHYVSEGDWLIPAAQTPFAQDAAFGFRSSNLCEWVAEKTNGRFSPDQVHSITIADLRLGGPTAVSAKLRALPTGSVCVVNSASYRDQEVLVMGLLTAEAAGKRFLYRTAASFVRVRAGIDERPLLMPKDLDLPHSGGGLFVIGSYVPKTSQQLEHLLQADDLVQLELGVEKLLVADSFHDEIARVAMRLNTALNQNQDVVIYTSRRLVTGGNAAESLAIGQQISTGLLAVLDELVARPRYLLAKGGITSSDVATKAVGMRRAVVRGQILPGVPVWQAGTESRYPGLTYIVFPGNVGDVGALTQIREKLR